MHQIQNSQFPCQTCLMLKCINIKPKVQMAKILTRLIGRTQGVVHSHCHNWSWLITLSLSVWYQWEKFGNRDQTKLRSALRSRRHTVSLPLSFAFWSVRRSGCCWLKKQKVKWSCCQTGEQRDASPHSAWIQKINADKRVWGWRYDFVLCIYYFLPLGSDFYFNCARHNMNTSSLFVACIHLILQLA